MQYSYLLGPLNSNVNEPSAAVLDNSHGSEFILLLSSPPLFFASSDIFIFSLMKRTSFLGKVPSSFPPPVGNRAQGLASCASWSTQVRIKVTPSEPMHQSRASPPEACRGSSSPGSCHSTVSIMAQIRPASPPLDYTLVPSEAESWWRWFLSWLILKLGF